MRRLSLPLNTIFILNKRNLRAWVDKITGGNIGRIENDYCKSYAASCFGFARRVMPPFRTRFLRGLYYVKVRAASFARKKSLIGIRRVYNARSFSLFRISLSLSLSLSLSVPSLCLALGQGRKYAVLTHTRGLCVLSVGREWSGNPRSINDRSARSEIDSHRIDLNLFNHCIERCTITL